MFESLRPDQNQSRTSSCPLGTDSGRRRGPKPIVDQLSKALQAAVKDPAVKQRFVDLGAVPVADASATPTALQTRVKSEIDRWTPIIKAAGQYAD